MVMHVASPARSNRKGHATVKTSCTSYGHPSQNGILRMATEMPINRVMTIQQYGQFIKVLTGGYVLLSAFLCNNTDVHLIRKYENFMAIFPGPAAGTFHPNSEVSLECLHSAHCSTSLASQNIVIKKFGPFWTRQSDALSSCSR